MVQNKAINFTHCTIFFYTLAVFIVIALPSIFIFFDIFFLHQPPFNGKEVDKILGTVFNIMRLSTTQPTMTSVIN